ncbi:hypothetical protein JQ574_26290 [Bradyrhizobium sp. AUGA SZCCT0158]|uniref:hypothetical protein n=1 Tax=Bradyrhizobium sp. AUGA SZCCT0158 TaxID=2807661 RepID=UPI001BA60DF5|nr:hypothetical protein [Bradyrhizobium sp. AUGA SZCCT0158]MBR1199513.1 hypothetical protein [Bradyrhizobium sp. AUGA SZCCT0158]
MIRRAKNLARRFIAGYNSVHSVETVRPAPPSLAARLGHDQIQDAQIKLLDAYLEEAADRRVAETDIVNFFTARPEQAAVVASSNYYLARHPHSVALRVAVLASLYVLEKDDECRLIADSLIAIDDCDLHRYFQSRVAYAIDGHEAALKCLLDGEAKFRESYLLKLAIIACLVEKNEISAANDRLAKIADRVSIELAEEISIATKNQNDLVSNRSAPDGEKDIYTDEFCRTMWISYYESFVTRRQRQHGDVALLNQYVGLMNNIPSPAAILEFGTMCAQPLYAAARMNPDVSFYGCDRQTFLKRLNEIAYPQPNMHFRDGDIFDSIEEVSRLPGRKALAHLRTSVVMVPSFVSELYQRSAKAGINDIVFIESAGMVRSRLEFLEFDKMPMRAVITKHNLHLHDYKTLLEEAGYKVNWKRQPTIALWTGWGADAYLGSGYLVHAHRE